MVVSEAAFELVLHRVRSAERSIRARVDAVSRKWRAATADTRDVELALRRAEDAARQLESVVASLESHLTGVAQCGD